VTFLDTTVMVSAMVVALVSGLYAGMGLQAKTQLDRRAELWFASFMWAAALTGLFLGGLVGKDLFYSSQVLGIGMVNGAQVLLMGWSVLHFPNVRTLETPMPRLFPMFALLACLVSVILLATGVVVTGLP
jgi:hypothetical protein